MHRRTPLINNATKQQGRAAATQRTHAKTDRAGNIATVPETAESRRKVYARHSFFLSHGTVRSAYSYMVSLHAGEERSGVVSLGRQPARPKPDIERTGSYLAVCKPPRAQANSAKLLCFLCSLWKGCRQIPPWNSDGESPYYLD